MRQFASSDSQAADGCPPTPKFRAGSHQQRIQYQDRYTPEQLKKFAINY